MGWINNTVAAVWNAGRATGSLLRPRAETPGPGADYWYEPTGSSANHAGVTVTPDIALKSSCVYSCIKVLAETISTTPVQMVRDLPGGWMEPAPEHPLDEIIRYQPNQTQTAVEFWEMMMLHAGLRGCAYAEIVPGLRGAVDQLLPLHTDRVQPERLRDGTLRFIVTNPTTGAQKTLLQEEVFRIPGMSSDGIRGLRAVDLAAEAIGLGLAADAYAARVFSNNLNIGGYLIHPKKLSPEAQKNLVQRLMERFAGIDNAHRPIVLQEGMDFKPASMNGRDAQLLEARKWQIGEIARYWRIPLFMLGIDQTGANSEQQALDFVKYTLRPWVRRIEQAIRRDLIVAKGTYSAKFNMDALLRADSAARAEYFSKALGAGGSPPWMKQNEVRHIEGLPREPDPRADSLGVGTNPRTDTPPAAAALEDRSLEAAAKRLVTKEITAIRKAVMRLAGDADAFREWAKAFYGGHVAMVVRELGLTKPVARVYCTTVLNQLLGSNDIESTLTRWEDTRAAEITETLARAGRKNGDSE